MSGPVTSKDTRPEAQTPHPSTATVEIAESRTSHVGTVTVRRALPRRERRTVGPFCFIDHMGPVAVEAEHGLDVAPHPHIGLQTVTWLLEGEALHRDSLGTEQIIAPGQLNLMTAGHGVSHSEEGTGRYEGQIHGVQLWIAQPETTRHSAPAFEHLAELPQVDLQTATATVIVGEFAGTESSARHDTDHTALDLDLRTGTTTMPLRSDFEHALVLLTGAVQIGGTHVEPGHLAYLGIGRDELDVTVDAPVRALLVGGVPLVEPVLMWWNYVARSRDEITAAHADWTAAADRFGRVDSALPRIDGPPPPWTRG